VGFAVRENALGLAWLISYDFQTSVTLAIDTPTGQASSSTHRIEPTCLPRTLSVCPSWNRPTRMTEDDSLVPMRGKL
jgi:hypothetical protein